MSDRPEATRTRRPLPVRLPVHAIQVLYSEHLHGFRGDWLQHDFAKLAIVDGGFGTCDWARERHALQAGDVLLLPQALLHRWSDDSDVPLRLLIICFDPANCDADLAGWLQSPRQFSAQQRQQRLAVQLLQEQQRQGSGWRARMRCLLELELIALQRSQEQHNDDPLMEGARAHIAAHLDQALSIEALAADAGISYRSFTQRFKRCYGKTAQQYQRQVRIEAACDLLSSGVPIIETALALGYSDNSNFYKAFKQELQLTPAQWMAATQA